VDQAAILLLPSVHTEKTKQKTDVELTATQEAEKQRTRDMQGIPQSQAEDPYSSGGELCVQLSTFLKEGNRNKPTKVRAGHSPTNTQTSRKQVPNVEQVLK
jgi:hypothetical protein